MSDLVVARNCCMARMLPGEVELVSECRGLTGVKCNIPFFATIMLYKLSQPITSYSK